jgi:outer membrane protein
MIKNFKIRTLQALVSVSILASSASADFLGAQAGYALWSPSLSGTIQKGNDEANFENDLGFGSKKNNSFLWAYVDHPIPLLPNLKIQQTNYTDEANGKLSKSIVFAGKNLGPINANTTTKFTLNQTDIIAYWRLLDNWVNFDFGFNMKNIDGNIKINSIVNENFSAVLPMLYAKAKFDLPFSGLSIEADISTISYDKNKITDLKAGISYNIIAGLGTVVGLKKQQFVLDDIEDVNADIDISGIYAGLYYHF